MRKPVQIAVLAATLGLAACASVPPPTEAISAAELAVRNVELSDSADYARLDAYQAREKLEEAKHAADDGRNLEARRLAETALVEAQLAQARADAARAEQNVDEIRKNIAAIELEAERSLQR